MRDLKSDLDICQKATPGPWKPFRDTFEPAIYTKLEDGCRGVCVARLEGFHGERQRNDANFIAAARTGWPEAIERAIKAESKNTESYDLLYSVFDTTKEEAERLKDDNSALREENDLQRHSIQRLSAQVAGLREGLKWLRSISYTHEDDLNPWPSKETRDYIDGLITSPDPGAEIMERLKKLEAAAEAAKEVFRQIDLRTHTTGLGMSNYHAVTIRVKQGDSEYWQALWEYNKAQALAELAGDAPCT